MPAYNSPAYDPRAYRKLGSGVLVPPDPGGDSAFNRVSLLMHNEGVDGSTVFTDSSSYAHTPSSVGGATIQSAWKKAGLSSQRNAALGEYVSVPSHSSLHLGAFDFTLEASIYLTAFADNSGGNYLSRILTKDTPGQREWIWYLQGTAGAFTSVRFGMFSGLGAGFAARQVNMNFYLNTLYNMALVRYLGQLYFFVNGILQVSSGSAPLTFSNGTAPVVIGGYATSGTPEQFYGYIDEVRITKAFGRYDTNYTPATGAFPDSI